MALLKLFANQQNTKSALLYRRSLRPLGSNCFEIRDWKEDIVRVEIDRHRARVFFGRHVFYHAVTIW